MCAIWFGLTGRPLNEVSPSSLEYPFLLILTAQLIRSCGEELGWRCYQQPELEQRFSLLTSAVIIGVMWGIWHVGIFAEGIAYAGSFILMAVGLSIIMAVLVHQTGGNHLWIAGVFHMLINIGMLLLMNEESGTVAPMLVIAIASMIGAVFALVWMRMSGNTLVKTEMSSTFV